MYEQHRRRKRRRKRVLKRLAAFGVILAAVLAVGLGGIGLWRLFQKPPMPEPSETLEAYMKNIAAGDYGAIYELLNAESQGQITKEELTARYENIYDGIEAQNVTFTIDTVFTDEQKKEYRKSKTAAMNYTISMNTIAGPLSFPSSTLLTYAEEEKRWRMTWDVSEVFPGLTPEYKVKVRSEAAQRGGIYDAFQNPLAAKGEAWSAGIVPGKLEEPREEGIAKAAQAMGVSAEKIEKALSAAWVKDDLFVPIRTFSKSNTSLKEKMLEVPGILLNTVEARTYPGGRTGSHMVGYVQSITAEELEEKKGQHYNAQSVIGKAGLEKALEEQLREKTGYSIELVDEEGNTKKKVLVKEPENGQDVRLTIEQPLQDALFAQLDGDRGMAVALNPVTGDILGMVSTPAYDSNDFAFGYTSEDWEAVNADEGQPLYNRVKGTWVPGSSFKPVTAAIALENGLDPEEDKGDEGLSWQADASWGDYEVTTLENYAVHDLKNAMLHSDNIYFAKAALETGSQNFAAGLEKLGFAEGLPFVLALNPSTYAGEGEELGDGPALADAGYGQSKILVNPVHLATIYASFMNGGNLMTPNLLYGSEPTVWKENAVSEETARTVLDCLRADVEAPEGTAAAVKMDGIVIAAKTGTAEKKLTKEDTEGTELGWFVAMTPEEENPLVIVMMIEDVKGRGGSHYVVPKVKAVLEAYYGKGR